MFRILFLDMIILKNKGNIFTCATCLLVNNVSDPTQIRQSGGLVSIINLENIIIEYISKVLLP